MLKYTNWWLVAHVKFHIPQHKKNGFPKFHFIIVFECSLCWANKLLLETRNKWVLVCTTFDVREIETLWPVKQLALRSAAFSPLKFLSCRFTFPVICCHFSIRKLIYHLNEYSQLATDQTLQLVYSLYVVFFSYAAFLCLEFT